MPESGSPGDLWRQAPSPAFDKALRLPNINDRFAGSGPDIGPFETGLDWPPRTLTAPLADDPR